MERKKKPESSLAKQMKARAATKVQSVPSSAGNTEVMISTGSTLLDLAISGQRVHGGGLPGGILVEIFGPNGTGKTVFLCEIGGAIQRQGGSLMFHDPEARLNKQFASMFDLDTSKMSYDTPDTVPQVFKAVRAWAPTTPKKINGIMADSLAALSTDLEMGQEDGDKMGMRRAKELSEECRKTARILSQNNYLMVASNQVRVDVGGMGNTKYKTPGGEAVGFYSSVRLQIKPAFKGNKIKKKVTIKGKEVERIVGINIDVHVFKNSVAAPYKTVPVTIIFDYGIDDVRQNLQFIKTYTKSSTYIFKGEKLAVSLEQSIKKIERYEREDELKEEVIALWAEIEEQFVSNRKRKR